MPSNNLTVARFVALKANIWSDEIEGDAPLRLFRDGLPSCF